MIYEVTDPDPLPNGKIGLGSIWDWHCHFDDIKVTRIESETACQSAYPAPVPKTGQTISYAAGDDGALQKGVTWPVPRFTDNGDGTVTVR